MGGCHCKAAAVMAVVAAIASATTVADDSYWYFGGSIGAAWASDLEDLTAADVAQAVEITGLPPEVTPPIVSTDQSSASFEDFDEAGWKLYGGYQFNRYVGVEAMYTDLASFDREARLSGAVGLFSPAELVEETEVTGFGLSLLVKYPLSDSFSVFAKAGAFRWETDTSGDLNIQTDTVCAVFICAPVARRGEYRLDESGTDPAYGLGLMFDTGSLSFQRSAPPGRGCRYLRRRHLFSAVFNGLALVRQGVSERTGCHLAIPALTLRIRVVASPSSPEPLRPGPAYALSCPGQRSPPAGSHPRRDQARHCRSPWSHG